MIGSVLSLAMAMQDQHRTGMTMLPAPVAAPAACPPEHAAMGHCKPAPATTAAPVQPVGTDQSAGTAPPPPVPRVGLADTLWDADAMAASRAQLYREHGGGRLSQVMVDIAEWQVRRGRDGYRWDATGWFGGDRDRLVVKSEGEGVIGRRVDHAELQALYSRTIGPYFNVQGGVRYDPGPRPRRSYATVGIEGLAPYWFDVEARLFVSERGDVSVRGEVSYDQRITQRLILQPRVEINAVVQAVPELGLGRGLSDMQLDARLRYEIARTFAPYVGVSWERRLGSTARYARAAGEGASHVNLVAGIRGWF